MWVAFVFAFLKFDLILLHLKNFTVKVRSGWENIKIFRTCVYMDLVNRVFDINIEYNFLIKVISNVEKLTAWFASERTLNVVIIWLQVIDYQKINALNFSQKSVLDRLLHMLLKFFIHFEKIFFWEDFLLRKIFFPEDFL